MIPNLANVWARRELIGMLVARNLKIRYKNSALGFFWTLLGPLFLILIYTLFLGILRFKIDLPVLITGILVWQFLAMCAGDSLNAIVGNANLVKKTSFPRVVLTLSTVLANGVNFLLSLLVLAVYLIAVRAAPGPLGWLPLALASQFALALGLALILSSANVFFRDTEHILGTGLTAWFFLTPIIYPVTLLAEVFERMPWIRMLYFANPMAGIVTCYRRFFLGAPPPPTAPLLISLAVSWGLLAVGWLLFHRVERRFAEVL
ncbi:MAG: ABC transporter permease [Kiritimatiellia bacterium]|nr:ABC transporter permease [Kiritimatiellia bacterium]